MSGTNSHDDTKDVDFEVACDPGAGKHVLFFGDPMCSWCWGFAPELVKIRDAIQGRAKLHMIMGGLRPGTRDVWDSKLHDAIRHHWDDVNAKTGQAFDFSRFDDKTFVYNTEPSCRAVVVARRLALDQASVFFEALQRAFYAEGRDITKIDTLTAISGVCGLDSARFQGLFSRAQAHQVVRNDFLRTRAFGVTGFPSIVCAEDGRYALLTQGYLPYTVFAQTLEEWLNA